MFDTSDDFWSHRMQELFIFNRMNERDRAILHQWRTACESKARKGHHPADVFKDDQRPGLYLSPYASAYFANELPNKLPTHSRASHVAIMTDLDVRFLHYELGGISMSYMFNDIINDLHPPETDPEAIHHASLWGFFDRETRRNIEHMPVTKFDIKGGQAALIVIPASMPAQFHLSEMAGVWCITVPDEITDHDVHLAYTHHELSHLTDDSEIVADAAALNSMDNQSLVTTWLDARVVGGFMWPIPSRQNGLAMTERKFQGDIFQGIQMDVVHDWCDHVFQTFYNPKLMTAITRGVFRQAERHGRFLPDDLHDFFDAIIFEHHNDVMEQMPLDEFEDWFDRLGPANVRDRALRYIKQNFMMHLQISNAKNPDFYGALNTLSHSIVDTCEETEVNKILIHTKFQESLGRLIPDLPAICPEEVELEAVNVQLIGAPNSNSPVLYRNDLGPRPL